MLLALLEHESLREKRLSFTQVDWATMTYGKELNTDMDSVLAYLMKTQSNKGYVLRPLKNSLMQGKRIGKLSTGSLRLNAKVNYVSVSGALSQILAIWATQKAKTTRLDIAVDIVDRQGLETYRRELEDYYENPPKAKTVAKNVRIFKSKNRGFTFYEGVGGKSFLLRAYDKGAQMEAKPGVWLRWELQVGREYATRCRDAMLESMDVTKWMKDVVSKYCLDRSIPMPLRVMNEDNVIMASRVQDEGYDVEKKKLWFGSTVVPFVKKLGLNVGDEYILTELGYSKYYKFMVDSFKLPLKDGDSIKEAS